MTVQHLVFWNLSGGCKQKLNPAIIAWTQFYLLYRFSRQQTTEGWFAAAAGAPFAGALPRLALPHFSLLLCLHLAHQIRKFQSKKVTSSDCSWVIFQPGEFPNPVHGVTIQMSYDSVMERLAQGRDKVVYAGGFRGSCRLQVLCKATKQRGTDSWVEPGSKCHFHKWATSCSLTRLVPSGGNQHQHIWLLPADFTSEKRSYNLFFQSDSYSIYFCFKCGT